MPSHPQPSHRLHVLGGFRLRRADEREVPLPSRKARALLTYLAMQPGREHPREFLAGLLWGDRQHEQARQSLRQALSEIRRALDGNEQAVRVTRDSASVGTGLETDATAFGQLLARATPKALAEAVALYGGPLLEGNWVDEEEFNGWLHAERARLHEQACDAIFALARGKHRDGDGDAAAAAAARVLAMDPVREEAHRLLMRLHAEAGRRSEALRQFRICTNALSHELDVEPSLETRRLHEEIRDGQAEPAHTAAAAAAVGEPTVAVLAFKNLSGDPEQDYFGDALAENIITALHNVTALDVIASGSSFHYKGKDITLSQIGRELGARYVLDGSVQKSGTRMRIQVRLADTDTGMQRWAEQYDRHLDDLLAVQDEITRTVVTEIQAELTEGEEARFRATGTANPEALDLLWKGTHEQRKYTRESNLRAHAHLRRALELDPNFIEAIVVCAWTHLFDARFGWVEDAADAYRKSEELALRAMQARPELPMVYSIWGRLLMHKGDYDAGLSAHRKLVELSPNSPVNQMIYAWSLLFAGQPERSLATITTAMHLAPHTSIQFTWCAGYACSLLGRSKAANQHFQRLLERAQQGPLARTAWGLLIANHVAMGEPEQARAEVQRLLEAQPDYSIREFIKENEDFSFRDFSFLGRFERLLRQAGLPEH